MWLDGHGGVLMVLAGHGAAVGEKRKKGQREAAEASWARVMPSGPAGHGAGTIHASCPELDLHPLAVTRIAHVSSVPSARAAHANLP